MTTNYNNAALGRIGDAILEYDSVANFPAAGNESYVYVAKLTGQFYRWDGSVYYEHGPQGASTSTHASQHLTNGTDPIRLVEYTVPIFTTNINDLAHNNSDILYIDGDANNRELSGMVAPGFCCIKLLVNIDATFSIILKNQSTNSSTNNRFLVYTGSDYYLLPGQSVCVLYDTPSSRWRVL